MSLHPQSEGELAEMIRSATGPLSVRGGNTRGMAGQGTSLSTAGLSEIKLYEPGALTLVAGAGTPVAEIETALASEGQMLAFEPMDHRPLLGTQGEPTIGGVIAANVSGPRRIQAGAARDVLLGTRFVDGQGEIIKNGGRVMKNVTGYDLARFMAGSRGAYGVVATLKFAPKNAADALLVMTRAMASPFDVSGAAMTGGDVMIRIEGLASSVSYRAANLSGLGDAELIDDGAKCLDIWSDIRDVKSLSHYSYVWRLLGKPTALVPALLGAEMDLADDQRIFDWAGGLAWVGASDPGRAAALDAALHRLAPRIGGTVARVKAPHDRDAALGQAADPALAKLYASLSAEFDRAGKFSARAD